MHTSIGAKGRKKLLYRSIINTSIQHMKGGESVHIMFTLEKKNILCKEEMKTSKSKNTPDSQLVNHLIRTAEWVRTRGRVRPISEDPALEEQVGILFNMIRRRKKISLERLANETDFKIEEIIAFEAGMMKRLRMCEMLPVLAESVGIKNDWIKEIQTGRVKLQPQ